MIFTLFFLNLFFCNYQNVYVTIDISKEIQNDEVVVLSGTIYNGSKRNISFWEIKLFKSLYRGDIHWELVILKEEKRYFIPMISFKSLPPKVIKLKKNRKYFFEIPVSFKELCTDRFFLLESIESGNYEVQLIVSLRTPRNTTIKSNTIQLTL